jgi:DNA topoisomerase-1
LLENHFPDLVDPKFTSKMEETLDDIATGSAQWLPYLDRFYRGEKGLESQVKERESQINSSTAKSVILEDLQATIKIGKYGPYLEVSRGDEILTASIPADLTPADLNPEQVETLLRQKTEGPDKIGLHPDTGEPIYLLVGSYGPYVQLGDVSDDNPKPKRASLPKGVKPEDVTLEQAVGLLALPRLLGTHPLTGGKIKASLGRFGPYVVQEEGKEKEYRSLKAGDDVLTITLDRALALLAEPKKTRGTRGSTKPPLKELGKHPDDGELVGLYEGPYGVYIKHGKTNAKIPEGETAETLTLEQALVALAAKTTTAKKTTTKKTTSSTTKKTTSPGSKTGKSKTV